MNDSVQFTRLWTKAQPVVASYVSALEPDFHRAEDILQDVAVALLKRYGAYDPSRPFLPWAMGVARRVVLERRRKYARSILRFEDGLAEAVSEAYQEMLPELQEQSAALRDCLGTLTGRAREVVRMRYQDALEPRQIAERLKVAAGNVRVALNRARTALHSCLERHVSPKGRRT
jgi:RNA polymerase sigma-70 factor (ECF subfamily)